MTKRELTLSRFADSIFGISDMKLQLRFSECLLKHDLKLNKKRLLRKYDLGVTTNYKGDSEIFKETT